MLKTKNNNKLRDLDQELRKFLLGCDHQGLEKRVIEYRGQDVDVKRIMLHYLASSHMRLGHLYKAKSLFLEALQLGENINLVRNYSVCCFLLGELEEARLQIQRLQMLLEQQKSKLSPYSLLETQIAIGKFFEEEGLVSKAIQIYEQTLAAAKGSGEGYFEIMALCQLLRLKALFELHDNLAVYYVRLMAFKEGFVTKNLKIEIEHALLWAEISLIGPKHAHHRIKALLLDTTVPDIDKKFIFYDFIEEMILAFPMQRGQIKRPNFKHELDLYETEIDRLYYQNRTDNEPNLLSLSTNLPLGAFLRTLVLNAVTQSDENLAAELRRRFDLIVRALDHESQELWQKRINRSAKMPSGPAVLSFLPQNRALAYHSRHLDLSKKKGMLSLVAQLTANSRLTVDEAIRILWNSDYSPDYRHRLRMTVHRLNVLLQDLTSISKIIEVDTDAVSLIPSVKFEIEKQPQP